MVTFSAELGGPSGSAYFADEETGSHLEDSRLTGRWPDWVSKAFSWPAVSFGSVEFEELISWGVEIGPGLGTTRVKGAPVLRVGG